MKELIGKVQRWAEDKGIDKTESWKPQFKKIVEEVGEFKKELEISSTYENHEEEMVEMGDIMVTLIIMAQQRGYDLYDCLAMAYAKIKDRQGETINGSFVKQEDIGKLECSLGAEGYKEYKNLFIGDFSDDDKNKIYINEPLESNTIKFTEDGFTVKLENGVELIHVANGIVIRVAQGKETPMKPERLDGFRCRNCSGRLARQTDLVRQKYCHHCGQKIEWEETNERNTIQR